MLDLNGTLYTIEGCRTYRKTLHEREKEKTESDKKKMRIRSRQQRVCKQITTTIECH